MKKPKMIWTIIRMLTFIIVGLLNTVLIRPEDIGSWKYYVGYAFLVFVLIDLYLTFRSYRAQRK
ncbi:MAG: hypothetical protein HEP71_15050 [Roseivirga sp.]|nr:hypothetical protein [Roseivirga sp.]